MGMPINFPYRILFLFCKIDCYRAMFTFLQSLPMVHAFQYETYFICAQTNCICTPLSTSTLYSIQIQDQTLTVKISFKRI